MRSCFLILLILLSMTSFGQVQIKNKAKFAEHLINLESYHDAIYYINSNTLNGNTLSLRDSMNYLKGWGHYSLKELEASANSLLQVSSNSNFYLKSRFFAAYNYSHLKQVKHSDYILKTLLNATGFEELRTFELAGNALLKRDIPLFEKTYKQLEGKDNFAFSLEKQKLFDYHLEIKNHKNKSPFMAGLFSALIPGSGKIYAGKTGEGIASFIIVGAAGFTALENYNKLGAKHAKTILFSSLFSVLYIGNIYGSVFTVKLVNEEFNYEMDHKILFNMHIPLRNIFN